MKGFLNIKRFSEHEKGFLNIKSKYKMKIVKGLEVGITMIFPLKQS